MKNFVILGVGGYIAPRHLKAIKDTKNNLIASFDKNDSVGIVDSYFPNASFFVEIERFDRHIEKHKNDESHVDYFSICTPNYLHDAHIRMALRYGADAICEKPLVLNPWNLDQLATLENESSNKIYNVLQLRVHKSIIDLKRKLDNFPKNKVFDVDLTYLTSRGFWYYTSWKGDLTKSGGIATNIGVHFYDMLSFLFGKVSKNTVHIHSHDRAAGFLEFERARVRWFLSINYDLIPEEYKNLGKRTYRSITIDGEEVEFSDGFTDLHTRVYQDILNGKGFGLEETRSAIEIVHTIRSNKPIGLKGDYHPLAKKDISPHPFFKNK